MKKVSVVLPVYNESECIEKTLYSIYEYLKNSSNYHFIFVNDGSTDDTKNIIENKLNKLNTNYLSLISYPERKGKGFAVGYGVQYADGDYICFIDSDLAYSLEHLEELVEKLKVFDVVIGCRNLHPDSIRNVKFSRMIAGKVFNVLSNKILDLEYQDMQAGLKGFKSQVAKEIFKKQELTGFSFDAELLYLAKKLGYTIGEISAKVSEKHQYKISKVKLLKDSLQMFIDLLMIRFYDWTGRYE